MGNGTNFKFNKKPHWRILNISTIWNYLSNRAANAVIRWFNGKEGKGSYRWLQREEVIESRFVAACTRTLC